MAYSDKVKETAIRMMLPPENRSIMDISESIGIPRTTLIHWRKELRAKGHTVPSSGQKPERWSSRDKFAIVLETMPLSEVELAEYCRKKGLYIDQVRQWQENCQSANAEIPGRIAEIMQKEKESEKEIRQLKKELQRKEAALAEAAALLILQKKAEAIWGTSDEGN